MQETNCEHLWQVLESRDQTLSQMHRHSQSVLQAKETEIQSKEAEIHCKEAEIRSLLLTLKERDRELGQKEDEIDGLRSVAEERLSLIERQAQELEAICNSRAYKLARLLAYPLDLCARIWSKILR
ncbi:MAG: hypothetical protein AB1898_06210 [Acidobacteriota bacterium]